MTKSFSTKKTNYFVLAWTRPRTSAFIVLGIASMETSEMWVLDANTPDGDLRLLQGRQKGLRYWVEHRNGRFLIRTNAHNSPNYKLVTAPVSAPTQEQWQDLVPHDPNKLLEGIEVFAGHLAVYGRSNALPTLDIHRFNGDALADSYAITFPEAVYATRGAENPEFANDSFRFVYTSMTTADTTVDYHMDQRTGRWSSKSPCWAATTPPTTKRRVPGPPPATARKFLSRCCTKRA